MHTCHSHTRHMCKNTSLSLTHTHTHTHSPELSCCRVCISKQQQKNQTNNKANTELFCFVLVFTTKWETTVIHRQGKSNSSFTTQSVTCTSSFSCTSTHTRHLRLQSAHTQNNNIIIKMRTYSPSQSVMHNNSARTPAPLQPSMHNQSIYTRTHARTHAQHIHVHTHIHTHTHTRTHTHTHKQHTYTYTPTHTD